MENITDYEAMAKLALCETERQRISGLADMLTDSFRELAEVDTSGAQPLVTVLDIQNILRDDIAVKNISRDEILSNAPEQYDGYFQVPKTLD